jgi:hypothetical protein
MTPHPFDSDRVVRLLLADAVGSLGEPARAEVLAVAAGLAQVAREQMRPVPAGDYWGPQEGASVADAQRFYDREVVHHFQQAVHDLRLDTTWPACPRHPNHPLEYREHHGAWCCPRDGVPVAALGSLAGLAPSS